MKASIVDDLLSLAKPEKDFNLDPANARKHNDRNVDFIATSLNRSQQRKPIVVQKKGMVVRAGNGTLMAARKLGWTHVAAVVVDESDVEAAIYAISDNRSAELATWDNGALLATYRGLNVKPEDIGFIESEIEAIAAIELGEDGGAPDPNAFAIRIDDVKPSDKDKLVEEVNHAIKRHGYEARAY